MKVDILIIKLFLFYNLLNQLIIFFSNQNFKQRYIWIYCMCGRCRTFRNIVTLTIVMWRQECAICFYQIKTRFVLIVMSCIWVNMLHKHAFKFYSIGTSMWCFKTSHSLLHHHRWRFTITATNTTSSDWNWETIGLIFVHIFTFYNYNLKVIMIFNWEVFKIGFFNYLQYRCWMQ